MTCKVGRLPPRATTPTVSGDQPLKEPRPRKRMRSPARTGLTAVISKAEDVVTADCGPAPNRAFIHDKALSTQRGHEDVPQGDAALPSFEGLAGPPPAQRALLQAGGRAGVSSRTPARRASKKERVFSPGQSGCCQALTEAREESQTLQQRSSHTRFCQCRREGDTAIPPAPTVGAGRGPPCRWARRGPRTR